MYSPDQQPARSRLRHPFRRRFVVNPDRQVAQMMQDEARCARHDRPLAEDVLSFTLPPRSCRYLGWSARVPKESAGVRARQNFDGGAMVSKLYAESSAFCYGNKSYVICLTKDILLYRKTTRGFPKCPDPQFTQSQTHPSRNQSARRSPSSQRSAHGRETSERANRSKRSARKSWSSRPTRTQSHRRDRATLCPSCSSRQRAANAVDAHRADTDAVGPLLKRPRPAPVRGNRARGPLRDLAMGLLS